MMSVCTECPIVCLLSIVLAHWLRIYLQYLLYTIFTSCRHWAGPILVRFQKLCRIIVPPSPHLPCPVSKTVLYSEPCQPAVLCITRFEPGTVLLPTTQPILLSASEGGRFPNPDILQCYTMTRQRPRMIVGDARFEPKTSLPEQTVFKSLDRPHVLIPMRGSLLFCHCRPSFKIIYQ